MPTHASFLYSRNVANFLALVVTDGELRPDFDDEIVAGSCVVRAGEIVHGPTPGPARRHGDPVMQTVTQRREDRRQDRG